MLGFVIGLHRRQGLKLRLQSFHLGMMFEYVPASPLDGVVMFADFGGKILHFEVVVDLFKGLQERLVFGCFSDEFARRLGGLDDFCVSRHGQDGQVYFCR